MKLYTESELTALPLAQIKEIATLMGRKPSQGIRQYKSAWVSCVVRHQSKTIVVAQEQPEILQPQKDWSQATDLEVAIACVESDEFFGYDSTKSRERVARLEAVAQPLPNTPELDVCEYAPNDCDDDLAYELAKRSGNKTLQVWTNGEFIPYKDAVCAGWRRLIGTIKIDAVGNCEYFVGHRSLNGRTPVAESIHQALSALKQLFIFTQSRHAKDAWITYLG